MIIIKPDQYNRDFLLIKTNIQRWFFTLSYSNLSRSRSRDYTWLSLKHRNGEGQEVNLLLAVARAYCPCFLEPTHSMPPRAVLYKLSSISKCLMTIIFTIHPQTSEFYQLLWPRNFKALTSSDSKRRKIANSQFRRSRWIINIAAQPSVTLLDTRA